MEPDDKGTQSAFVVRAIKIRERDAVTAADAGEDDIVEDERTTYKDAQVQERKGDEDETWARRAAVV